MGAKLENVRADEDFKLGHLDEMWKKIPSSSYFESFPSIRRKLLTFVLLPPSVNGIQLNKLSMGAKLENIRTDEDFKLG
ncbi:hypothetical protein Tco_1248658 [Tanacetum coccineum]